MALWRHLRLERGVHLPDAVPLRQVSRHRKQQKRYRLAVIRNAQKVLWFPADQIRTCHQSQNGQGVRRRDAGSATRARRRGDRIGPLAAMGICILIFTPNFRFARERISARRSTDQVPDQKNLFLGLGNSRLSRSVLPSYSRRRIPRRCNSGTTRSTKSSSPPGRYGNCIVKPSEPSVISHSSISSAIVTGVPTIASPEWPPRRCASCRTVRFSRFARSIARCRPLFKALLSGMSGSGPSGSNFDASWPSAIDSEAEMLPIVNEQLQRRGVRLAAILRAALAFPD